MTQSKQPTFNDRIRAHSQKPITLAELTLHSKNVYKTNSYFLGQVYELVHEIPILNFADAEAVIAISQTKPIDSELTYEQILTSSTDEYIKIGEYHTLRMPPQTREELLNKFEAAKQFKDLEKNKSKNMNDALTLNGTIDERIIPKLIIALSDNQKTIQYIPQRFTWLQQKADEIAKKNLYSNSGKDILISDDFIKSLKTEFQEFTSKLGLDPQLTTSDFSFLITANDIVEKTLGPEAMKHTELSTKKDKHVSFAENLVDKREYSRTPDEKKNELSHEIIKPPEDEAARNKELREKFDKEDKIEQKQALITLNNTIDERIIPRLIVAIDEKSETTVQNYIPYMFKWLQSKAGEIFEKKAYAISGKDIKIFDEYVTAITTEFEQIIKGGQQARTSIQVLLLASEIVLDTLAPDTLLQPRWTSDADNKVPLDIKMTQTQSNILTQEEILKYQQEHSKKITAALPQLLDDFDKATPQKKVDLETQWRKVLNRDTPIISPAALTTLLKESQVKVARIIAEQKPKTVAPNITFDALIQNCDLRTLHKVAKVGVELEKREKRSDITNKIYDGICKFIEWIKNPKGVKNDTKLSAATTELSALTAKGIPTKKTEEVRVIGKFTSKLAEKVKRKVNTKKIGPVK